MSNDNATAGWIVRIDGADRAAGPTRSEALTTAEAIGFREHFGNRASVRPATAGDLDSLDLPPSALGIIVDGAAPWWRWETAAEAQRRFAAENDATADRLTAWRRSTAARPASTPARRQPSPETKPRAGLACST